MESNKVYIPYRQLKVTGWVVGACISSTLFGGAAADINIERQNTDISEKSVRTDSRFMAEYQKCARGVIGTPLQQAQGLESCERQAIVSTRNAIAWDRYPDSWSLDMAFALAATIICAGMATRLKFWGSDTLPPAQGRSPRSPS